VLGAAVADDVLGLVILTVVVRIVSTGSVSVAGVGAVIAVAVLFLLISAAASIRLAPSLFNFIDRNARSSGTLIALAIVFTLTIAEFASLARLAPIIGAFVAGLALGRSRQAERIRRDLQPLGHLLVPVFFVQIGVDVNVRELARPAVLGLAGGLLVVAVAGKVAAALAAVGTRGDRWLIGLGMLPRGEVGLIFAGLGLRQGVLGEDLYAALLLVVLGTTLLAPPLLRWRLIAVKAARRNAPGQAMPAEGWLVVDAQTVDLRGRRPSPELAVLLALQVALLVAAGRRAGDNLLEWFAGLDDDTPVTWDPAAHKALFAVLREGNARSWRFLESTSMLDLVLPELAATVRRRREDASELDPVNVFRWATVEEVHRLASTAAFAKLGHPEWVLLAALILDIAGETEPPVEAARQLVRRLRLGVAAEEEILLLITERGLLRAAAVRPDGLDEQRVLPLALRLLRPERVRALHLLTVAQGDLDGWVRERVGALVTRIEEALEQKAVTGHAARNMVEQRRSEAESLAQTDAVRERLAHAPRPWLLGLPADALARQAALLEPVPVGRRARVGVTGDRIEVACRDRRGLLAAVTGVLTDARLAITGATTATWPDGGVVMAFDAEGPEVDPARLCSRIEDAIGRPVAATPVPDASVTFDDNASPWYTIADVEARDRPGLLHALTAAFARAGVSIHSAHVVTADGMARDRFEVTDRRGEKLSTSGQAGVRAALADETKGRRRRVSLANRAGIFPKHSSHNVETATP
jgi:predicted amino acid-binding ACT domain protein